MQDSVLLIQFSGDQGIGASDRGRTLQRAKKDTAGARGLVIPQPAEHHQAGWISLEANPRLPKGSTSSALPVRMRSGAVECNRHWTPRCCQAVALLEFHKCDVTATLPTVMVYVLPVSELQPSFTTAALRDDISLRSFSL